MTTTYKASVVLVRNPEDGDLPIPVLDLDVDPQDGDVIERAFGVIPDGDDVLGSAYDGLSLLDQATSDSVMAELLIAFWRAGFHAGQKNPNLQMGYRGDREDRED